MQASGEKKNRRGNKKEFKIILTVWGQIPSRPEPCLGISPLFLTFPDVFPLNNGWEAAKHDVSPVPLFILCRASTALPAHKIPPAALGKMSKPPSNFTGPDPFILSFWPRAATTSLQCLPTSVQERPGLSSHETCKAMWIGGGHVSMSNCGRQQPENV